MGVVNRRWMWVESMSVTSECGCKELYRFHHKLLLILGYSYCICSFLQQHPYLTFLNVFNSCNGSFYNECFCSKTIFHTV